MRESVGVPYFVTKSCEARVVSIITSFSFLLFSSLASAFLLELIFLPLNGPENHCERDCLPARNVLHTILRLLQFCVNTKFRLFCSAGVQAASPFDTLSQVPRRDPIEVEIFKNLFHSIAEEMGAALRRTAFSPNIKERRDYSCAVCNAAGDVIAMG